MCGRLEKMPRGIHEGHESNSFCQSILSAGGFRQQLSSERIYYPISLMLYGGGETIEDVREIREDAPLRKLTGLQKIPSVSALGDWLRRMGERSGVVAMEKTNTSICRDVLIRDQGNDDYTLIVRPLSRRAKEKPR